LTERVTAFFLSPPFLPAIFFSGELGMRRRRRDLDGKRAASAADALMSW
jgi:hypothetical protein